MKLSPLKLSLLLIFLWESPSFSQAPLEEGARVGAPAFPAFPPPDSLPHDEADADGEGAAVTEGDRGLPRVGAIQSRKIIHANGYRGIQDEPGPIFDQGSYGYLFQAPESLDQRLLDWDLGLGRDDSILVNGSLRESRLWNQHRPSLEIAGEARAFEGSGAGLEEIYQSANRLGKDFTSFDSPATTRRNATLRLGDEIRWGAQSKLSLSGERHEDHFWIDSALDEDSAFDAGTLSLQLGLGKERSLATSFRRSEVVYSDHRKGLSQGQDLSEFELQLFEAISPLYSGGIGLRSLDGERNGPVISLIRKADERLSGQASLSYLKDHEDSQALGNLKARYRWTRLLTLNLKLEQGVDLLASFGSLAPANQSRGRRQRLNKAYELTGAYDLKQSVYSFTMQSNSQEFESARFTQQELRFEWDHKINPLDRLILRSAYRTALEQGQVQRVIDNRYARVDGNWRHFWGYDSRLFGGRSFGQMGLGYERIGEGKRGRERKTLSLALGQEWL